MRVSSGKIILFCLLLYGSTCSLLYFTIKKNLFAGFFKFLVLSGVIFALFALCYVLKGVLEFNNSDETFQKLKSEMHDAEGKLKSMGFSFDQFNINLSHDQQKNK